MLKQKLVTVPDDPMYPRDRGKSFLLTEMPADQAEKWAIRAFLAFKGTDAQIPMEVKSLGMVGVAIIGLNVLLRASVKFEEISPLLDEMMTCVKAVADKSNLELARPIIQGEILDVPTLGWLRSQVVELHTGFDVAGSLARLISEIMTTTGSLTT